MLIKPLIVFSLIVTSAALAAIQGTQEQQQFQQDTTKFMQKKLDSSRQIVEGLAIEDFEKISKSGQDLMLLAQEADWNVIQTEPYLALSREFRKSASRLRDAGNEKNLDGATLAYFEVTLSCVRCHKYIRQNQSRLPNQ
jgi:cytochrome c556